MLINADDTILFTGDSITDCGRVREDAKHLGFGYAAFIAARLQAYLASPQLKIFNRGISGNRAADLLGRVDADLLALKPTVVSILIGINDVWRRYDAKDPTSAADYEKYYRGLLEKITEKLTARVVLLEPFLLHVPEDLSSMARGLESEDRRGAAAGGRVRRGAPPARRPFRQGGHGSPGRLLGR